jgi:hypothetical protein
MPGPDCHAGGDRVIIIATPPVAAMPVVVAVLLPILAGVRPVILPVLAGVIHVRLPIFAIDCSTRLVPGLQLFRRVLTIKLTVCRTCLAHCLTGRRTRLTSGLHILGGVLSAGLPGGRIRLAGAVRATAAERASASWAAARKSSPAPTPSFRGRFLQHFAPRNKQE